jgi:predicted nucleotidyltransferase
MMFFEPARGELESYFRQYPITLVYLFGSRGAGRARADSDIDIAVLLKETPGSEGRASLKMDLLDGLSRLYRSDQIDLVILNEAPPLLAHEVLQKGILLYCTDEDVRIEFQVRTVREYEDTAQLRKIQFEAMITRLKQGTFGKRVMTPFDNSYGAQK